jgi:nitroreductase
MEAVDLPLSMPLGSALGGRASVRKFKPDILTRSQVRGLLAAAVRAPTARHQEAWSFVVVQDRSLLKKISGWAKPLLVEDARRLHVDRHGRSHGAAAFADPDFNIFYDAGTLILVCGPRDAPFLAADCWMAAENIVLAAHAAGLGACVIGSAVGALESEDIRDLLDIPASIAVVAPIIVGVPAEAAAPSPRSEPKVLHWSPAQG